MRGGLWESDSPLSPLRRRRVRLGSPCPSSNPFLFPRATHSCSLERFRFVNTHLYYTRFQLSACVCHHDEMTLCVNVKVSSCDNDIMRYDKMSKCDDDILLAPVRTRRSISVNKSNRIIEIEIPQWPSYPLADSVSQWGVQCCSLTPSPCLIARIEACGVRERCKFSKVRTTRTFLCPYETFETCILHIVVLTFDVVLTPYIISLSSLAPRPVSC